VRHGEICRNIAPHIAAEHGHAGYYDQSQRYTLDKIGKFGH